MNVLLSEPTAVLAIGSTVDEERLRAVLRDGPATEVIVVDSVADAGAVLSAEPVGCVVVTDDVPDASPEECCVAVADHDLAIPVVYYGSHPEVEALQRVVNAGAVGYVDRADPPERLAERVDAAMTDANERRVQREESDAFRTLLSEVDHSIYVKDAEGRHLRFADTTGGIDPERAHGKTDRELYPAADPEEAGDDTFTDDVRVLRDGEAIREKDEGTGDVGDKFWVRTTKVPWYDDDGSIKGLVGASIEISELKRAANQLAAMERRFDRFTTYLRHDLYNPLQVASGNVQLARETGDLDPLETALDALDRMEEMVDDIDSFSSRPNPIGGTIEHEPLRDLVEGVWDHVATDSAALRLDVPPGATITAGKPSVRPVVENLLRNAVDHGGPDVTVTVGTTRTGGFYVADDGPGIPEEDREKVLEIGYTTSDDGSGTGLNIVTELVDQHNWTIDVTESESGGVKFVIGECHVVADYDERRAGDRYDLDRRSVVGTLECEPEATYDADGDRWTISADGADIWQTDNDFYFVHATVDGPVRIQGKIVDVEQTNPYSKGGFMIRDALDEDATYGYAGVTPKYGTELLWRYERGTNGRSQHFEEPFHEYEWYRLDRDGSTITVSLSPDGEEWDAIDQRRVDLADPVHVGVVSCSVVPWETSEAVFESVAVSELLDE